MKMARIVPFRGIRYCSDKIGNLADVIIPPYDVITAEEQEQFYRRSPYNFIRLEFGKTGSGGDGGSRYTRAAGYLHRWREEKVLLLEKRPLFYLYRQSFTFAGSIHRRTGLIAALGLEPYSKKVILPHEDTLATPKADRLELMRHCRANFSPIFGLFSDPEERFAKICAPFQQRSPLYDFTDHYGEHHTLWPVEGSPREALARLLEPRQIFIADGHHRYDTALRYREEAASPGSKYVLAVLVPLEDPGLLILPFHRLLKGLTAGQLALLREKAARYFEVAEGKPEDDLSARLAGMRAPAMALLFPDRDLLLKAKDSGSAGELDVSLLKRLLLDPLFESAAVEQHLDFVTGEDEARRALQSGRAQAAVLLNPTPMAAVTARALKGENMPQKSTCFHPKLPAGLLIHHLEQSH
jgi:uncharacterized protein (DUF1015 family)